VSDTGLQAAMRRYLRSAKSRKTIAAPADSADAAGHCAFEFVFGPRTPSSTGHDHWL